MVPSSQPNGGVEREILSHYEVSDEIRRLHLGWGPLELARTQEIIQRYLPPPPAVVLDVGGGPGVYGCWLARKGYQVHLVDPVRLHVEQARRASRLQPAHPLRSVTLGDARSLEHPDASADAVLFLGPLYHLVDRNERLAALREAGRVVRAGGVILVAAISRFASLLDGLLRRRLADPEFAPIVEADLREGQHHNPTDDPTYFTTAYFHRPEELDSEIAEAGLLHAATLAVEGPGWLLQDFAERWADGVQRDALLRAIRTLEREPSVLGASAHLMAVARKISEPG